MPDHLTQEQRSYCMSRIRGKWTSLDKQVHNLLKGNKIEHQMYPKISGSPDLVLKKKKIAIFLHGCFWHGCKFCYRKPKNNAKFWKEKMEYNIKKDKKNVKHLKLGGWKVMIFWEHDFKKNPAKFLLKIK